MAISYTLIIPRRPVANTNKMLSELKRAMENTVADGLQYIQDYPPQPSTFRYRRTGTLGRSWSRKPVTVSSSSISSVVGSSPGVAPYNKQVQNADQQKPIFKRVGWRTDEELKDRMQARLQREADEAVRRAVR